jgi:hypothetical protein
MDGGRRWRIDHARDTFPLFVFQLSHLSEGAVARRFYHFETGHWDGS